MASDELKALIALVRENPYSPSKSIESLRSDSTGGSVPRPGTNVKPCDADGVYGEWVEYGTTATDTVLMYLHGGAYFRSSAKASRMVASNLSAACQCRVFTVDYRLAPEHVFPAAVDDSYTAFNWLQKQGILPSQIIVGGSSAGGGLTAALLAKLKLAGNSQPAAAILLSPWTDLTQNAETYISNSSTDPGISKIYLDRMANQYLNGADPMDPLASPIFSDLKGLPPLLVQVGKSETMFGDAQAYVEKVRKAGGSVEFTPFDDVVHGWHNSAHVVPDIPETLVAIDQIGTFFKRHRT